MLTCFGKPVAHVTLRSATAAAAMHRLCEQLGSQGRGDAPWEDQRGGQTGDLRIIDYMTKPQFHHTS